MVIPDELMPNNKIIERLHKYIADGGAVIVSHHAGLTTEKNQSWMEQYGFRFVGESPFKPTYLVNESGFVKDMPG